jgi:hypothetical protein
MTATAMFLPLLLLPAGAILVDKVAATVNGEIVTIHDIERAIALFPAPRRQGEPEGAYYLRVLDDLVTCKAVAMEFGDEFSLGEEDYAAVQTEVLQKAGSLEKLLAVLGGFAMNWGDLKEFIREKVLFAKALKEKFTLELSIPFAAIEDFYNRDYLPSQRQLNLEPRSLADMAPQIETFLRQRGMEARQAAWLADIRSAYTIEIKLRSPQ